MTDQETIYSPAEIRHHIGANGSFNLNNVSGDVRLHGVDGDEVVVRARWDRGGDQPLPLVVRRSASSLSVEMDDKQGWFSFRNRGGIDFDVSVPSGARIEVQAVSSDIKADGLTGDQSYKTVSGDLSIDGAGGRFLRSFQISLSVMMCPHALTPSAGVLVPQIKELLRRGSRNRRPHGYQKVPAMPAQVP